MHCCTYTSGLSTWSSSHGPYQVNPVGDFISKRASHLDAFSAYPTRRCKTTRPLARTTGTRALRPRGHRGAKPSRRYGLLGKMRLLSPGSLLSVEQRRFHKQPLDHYALLSHLLDL